MKRIKKVKNSFTKIKKYSEDIAKVLSMKEDEFWRKRVWKKIK